MLRRNELVLMFGRGLTLPVTLNAT